MKNLNILYFFASLLLLAGLSRVNAQTNCVLQIGSNAAATVCPGTPIVLTATTSAINVGTGVTGTLNVTGTYFTDAVRTAVVGTNTTGAGNKKVRVASTTGFATGDEVLVICMQDPNTNIASNLTGKYDFAIISSIAGDTLRFVSSLTNTYNTTGGIKYQVVEVPHFSNVNVANGGVMTCNFWNGSTGGVLCFRANGTVTINSGGSINANGKGYRGVTQKTAYWRNANGGQGEGILGTGIASGVNGAGPCNNNAAWNNANANGGGGGTGCGDSGGGGGGGYAAAGSTGVNWGHTPGTGGTAIGNSSLTTWFMGGAGGEGGADEDGAFNGAGGDGGGIVYIATNSLVINGSIASNGDNGNNASNGSPGSGCGSTAGGGGAGGSIIIETVAYSGSGSNITVNAGIGGSSVGGCNSGGQTGGNGSAGRIRFVTSGTGITTSPTAYTVSAPALTGLTYSWSTSVSTQTMGASPATTTIYTVTITGGSGCVGTSKTYTQTVFSVPAISVASTPSVCAGSTATYTLSGGLSTYSLNGASTNTLSTFAPSSSANYTLTGTSSNGCAAASVQFSINVVPLPTLSISGSTTACNGQPVTFTANGGSGYNWSVGGTNATVAVTPTSNFTLTLNGTNAQGCAGAAQQMAVTVFSTPVLSISGTNTLCSGGSVVLTGSGASTYTWSSGGNTNTTTVSPTSSTTYTLNGTSAQGCVANPVTQAVTAYSLPVLSISGSNTVCLGSSVILTGSGANTYTWNSSQNTSTISVNPSSTTTYSLNGLSSDGCLGNTAVRTVSTIALPIVAITGNTSICVGQTATLAVTGASSYTWSTGSNASSVSVSPTSGTTYTVTGASALGCQAASAASLAVTVFSLPVLSVSGANTLCVGQSIVLTANGASTYSWSNTTNGATTTVSPSSTTTYTLGGTSAQGCVGVPATYAVTAYSLPVLSITGTNTLCVGSSVVLTANGANTYSWSTSQTTGSITVSPVVNTTYSLTGLSSNGCSGNTAVVTVTANALPTVAVAGTTLICQGQTTTLTASGANSYAWSGGPATAAYTVAPSATTNYTVIGTSVAGCTSNAVRSVSVQPAITVSIAGSNTLCAGQTVTLTASGATTYTWSNNANTTTIAVTPAATTAYTVQGVNGVCAASAVRNLTVNPNPTVSITGTTALCTGSTVSLTVNGATSYSWSNNATTTAVAVSPTANATYSVIGSFSTGCAGSASTSITVFSLPVISVSGNSFICVGDTTVLQANGASTYVWNTSATTSTISQTPSTTTSYTAIGTNSNGCVNAAALTVTVNALPTIVFSGNTPICAGNSSTVSASGANTYTWNSGTNGNTVVITPTVLAGYVQYSVAATSTANCKNSKVDSLLVYAIPTLTISGGSYVCNGNVLTLTVSGANTYTWDNGANSTTIAVTPTANTSYTAVGTSTDGCLGTAVNNVSVVAFPVVTITNYTAICMGDSLVLTANGANTYTWNSGATGSITVAQPTANTSYSVVGEIGAGCVDTAFSNVVVNTLPTLVTTPSVITICEGETANLTVSGASTYTWSGGTTGASIAVSPTVTSSYSVTGTSTDNCVSSTSVNVTVDACTRLQENEKQMVVIYPNPSSGHFSIELNGRATLSVYNVTGQRVYTSQINREGRFDLSGYSNGIYLVRLVHENGMEQTKQVIKQ